VADFKHSEEVRSVAGHVYSDPQAQSKICHAYSDSQVPYSQEAASMTGNVYSDPLAQSRGKV
jgi:hypothetical protein